MGQKARSGQLITKAFLLCLCLLAGAWGKELEVLPVVGPVTRDTAVLWFQAREPRTVSVLVVGPGGGAFDVDCDEDAIGTLHLEGLTPGTRYEVRVTEPANWLPISFRTQPDRPGSFTFAFGSCAYVNDARYPQGENGGDYQVFTSIAADRPDLMLWLGDNVYYRHGDWESEERMRARWRADRWTLETWWPVFAGMANYPIWDDHDFGPNDADSSFALRDTALEVFRSVWPGLAEERAYYRFSWEDVDFFMLDDRYHRNKTEMLGPAQLAWLKQGLLESGASFKVVACGSQLLNPMFSYEAWAVYPAERQGFLDWLEASRVEGVVFLSGDRHSAELIRLEGAYPLYDFTSSPLTSSLHKQTDRELANPARVPGTSLDTKRNYGLGRVSGPMGDRALTFECKDTDGHRIWARTLLQRELRPQNRAALK